MLRFLARRRHGGFDLDLRVAVGAGHFIGRAVGGGDQFEHIGFGFVRMRRDFRAQIFLGVVQRVLNERGIRAGKLFAELARGIDRWNVAHCGS